MKILPFTNEMLSAGKAFTDEQIGTGYFSEEQLKAYIHSPPCSLVLMNDRGEIKGVRLTIPAASLPSHPVYAKLTPKMWKTSPAETAYFQSLFIHPSEQKKGWGSRLSKESVGVLAKQGCRAITTHCWKESPGNSSFNYLKSIGFEAVREHKNFWIERDYQCTRCGKPCVCTAIEMIRYLP